MPAPPTPKHGGKRNGAGRKKGTPGTGGRPLGSKSALRYGEVKAVKALGYRVPDGTPEDVAADADEAWQRIVAVMRGKVHSSQAPQVLKASTRLRDEVCGPPAQKVAVAGVAEEPLQVSVSIHRTVKGEG